MDNAEMKSLLMKIIEGQTNLEVKMTSMETEMTTMRSEITTMRSEITTIKSDITSLNGKVDKNTMMLEKLSTDVKTIAEIQGSFAEQMGRSKSRDGKSLDQRLDIIELAVTNSHNLIKDMDNKIENLAQDIIVVEALSGKNMKDIAHLKLIK